MSTQIPPPSGRSSIPQSQNQAQTPVQIVSLPEAIQQQVEARSEALRIRGEVEAQNRDGTIRIKTPDGDVDVRVRDNRNPPQRGQTIEIEIPPRSAEANQGGRENASIREVRVETPQQRPSGTPVDVQVRGNDAPPPQQPTHPTRQPLPADVRHAQNTNQLPPEGSVVRLQPLPIRDAQNLPLPVPETLPQVLQSIPARVEFQAVVIGDNAVNDLQTALLNVRAPQVTTQIQPLPQTQIASLFVQNAAQPVTLNEGLSPPKIIAQAPTPSAPQSVQAPVTALPSQTPQVIQSALPVLQNIIETAILQTPITKAQAATQILASASLQPARPSAAQAAPSVFATQPSSPPIKAEPLDVQITRILPPDASLAAPRGVSPALQTAEPQNIIQAQAQNTKPETLILQNQKAGSLTGIVTSVTAGQLPVISVFFPQLGSEQIFALQFPTESITIGTQLQVTPQTQAQNVQTTISQTATPALPLPLMLAPQLWNTMDDALQTVARAAPQAAQAMVNVSPAPTMNPAQLGPAILFFVAAVRGGDLSQWLGEKTSDLLRTQKSSIFSRLMGEGQTLSRIAAEPTPQDWRAMNIPLYYEGDMHKIGLYYRHEYEQSEADEHTLKGTRFVFDLALENMGKVQLDGLYRPVSDMGKRLDLVLRTEEHFSENTRAEMRRIYAKGLKDSGVSGELSFQNSPESWVTIQADEHNRLGVEA